MSCEVKMLFEWNSELIKWGNSDFQFFFILNIFMMKNMTLFIFTSHHVSSYRCLTAGFWRERNSPAGRTTSSHYTNATQTTAPPQHQEPPAAPLRTLPWSFSAFTALTVASPSSSKSYTTLSVSPVSNSWSYLKAKKV